MSLESALPARTPIRRDLRQSDMAQTRARPGLGLPGLIGIVIAVAAAYWLSPLLGLASIVVAFGYLIVARPEIGLALILAVTPFQYDLGVGLPVRVSLAEMGVVAASGMLLFIRRGQLIWGSTLIPSVLYLCVCALSSIDNFRGSTLVSIAQMVVYLILTVVVFANTTYRLKQLSNVFDLYVAVATVMAILGVASGFSTLGLHKNGWGASLSTAVIVSVELWLNADPKSRRKLLLMLAALILSGALVLTVSRGGWMAAGIGVVVVCAVRRQFLLLMKVGLALLPVLFIAWSYLPADLQEYATGFEKTRWNIKLRYESMDFALKQYAKDPIFGTGVGLRKEYDATNIFLSTLAETGWVGLLAFLSIHIVLVASIWRDARQLPKNHVLLSLLVLAGALVLARLTHGAVDHYWSRGPITCAWAAVGITAVVSKRMQIARQ